MNSKPCVMVVDDDPFVMKLLKHYLCEEDYLIHFVENGEKALNTLKEHPVDLAVVDVIMPGMNGFDLCRAIKAKDEWSSIPVIMATTLSEKTDRIESIHAGADEFLTKPIDALELRTRIKALLRTKQLNDTLKKNYQRLQYQLTLARQLQTSFIPSSPIVLPSHQVDFAFVPCEEVSGDVLEIRQEEGRTIILLGDSVGHGIPAALVSFMVRSVFTNLECHASPAQILTDMNSSLYSSLGENPEGLYCTCICCIIDQEAEMIHFANGGHPPGYIETSSGVDWVKNDSLPLGIMEAESYENFTLPLDMIHRVVLYSDGLMRVVHSHESEKIDQDFLGKVSSLPELGAWVVEQKDKLLSSLKDDLVIVRILRKDKHVP